MSFIDERCEFERELDAHYAAYPTDLSLLEQELHALSSAHPEWLPYARKAAGYRLIAERCRVKVFRYFPLYFELDTGRARTDLGAGGIGGWMKREPAGLELQQQGESWCRYCWESGLSAAWAVLDDNHHSIGNDNVFRWGLNGSIARAQSRLGSASSEKERAFLESVIAGNRALISVAERFAAEAERLLAGESDPAVHARLRRTADTARRVPAEPPATFYEALNTLLFMREVVQEMEGNGNSTVGHLDRILWPYYLADLAAGRLTPEEAEDLLRYFLAFHDVRFGMRQVSSHVGTNTTVMIGGCDATGRPVFNDLTRMVLRVYRELSLVDPKLNARISAGHPREYFELLGELMASGSRSLAFFNDDVIIPANTRMGKAVEDCRLYMGGGCQENLLENTEINSRASIYLNLGQVLLLGFFPQLRATFTDRAGITPAIYHGCERFEELYAAFLSNLEAMVNAHIDQRNRTEAEGWHYNPCPLHSSTLSDCIDKGLDMMEGGARYSFGSVSLTGAGTVVDSLYAIRQVVYEERRLSLERLAGTLADNFEGEEALRQHLLRRVPKFGQDDVGIRAFSAQVFADMARVSSGRPNTRGGRYEASLFCFRAFTSFGAATGATPDGRPAAEHLSPGMGPSYLALRPGTSVGHVLDALEPLDLTLYPVVAVLDVKLPAGAGSRPDLVPPILQRFLAAGGSVIQINCVDPETLLDAREHPERHPDLVVRISGYSAYFTTLPAPLQDEVIARALLQA